MLQLRLDARGHIVALFGIILATAIFWILRSYVDKGQASLLYLPVVIAIAVRFGFNPAVSAAIMSFLAWNFFFLPPRFTLFVHDPRDWISLGVFLVAAVSTGRLASIARLQTQQAEMRERETITLHQASEALITEVDVDRLLPTLARQLLDLCKTDICIVFDRSDSGLPLHTAAIAFILEPSEDQLNGCRQVAAASLEQNQVIGIGGNTHLWRAAVQKLLPHVSGKSVTTGVYVPLRVHDEMFGVLYVGGRSDELPFTLGDERLILTFANHAATTLARRALSAEAAEAEALRKADEVKDALLSLVSHELRTPLATIKAVASGLLQSGVVWSETDTSAAIFSIDTEVDRLTQLVNNLLDLSRLQAGAWVPEKDWCDVSEIVGTVIDRMKTQDSDRITIDIPELTPLIKADFVQIALVLSNLLENAAKYSPACEPIRVYVGDPQDGDNPTHVKYLQFNVRDHGAGILLSERTELFQPFVRGRTIRRSTIHGTGLGLALCLAIVDAHGGRIWAANAPANEPPGAIFSFTLPVE